MQPTDGHSSPAIDIRKAPGLGFSDENQISNLIPYKAAIRMACFTIQIGSEVLMTLISLLSVLR